MAYYVGIYCHIEIFLLFEKVESKKENKKCMIKGPTLHLRLRLWGKAPCRWKIEVSSNLAQVVMF